MIIRIAADPDVERLVTIINAAYRRAESGFITGARMTAADPRLTRPAHFVRMTKGLAAPDILSGE